MRILDWIVSREGRKWLYGVAVAIVPLLVLYGAISPEAAPIWLSIAGAVLAIGAPVMALSHMTPPAGRGSLEVPEDIDQNVILDVEDE